MKKRVYGSMLLLSLLGFSSCNNDLSESTSMVQEQSLMQERAESPLQSLAIRLAHVVTNPQVREFIKNEVSKQEDGDFEILLSKALDKEIPSSDLRVAGGNKSTLRDLLMGSENVTRAKESSIKEILEEIQANYPLLQIAIPNMESASWENVVSGERPFLVAFLDEDYDDMSGEPIPAYDQDGQLHMLDGVVAPEDPVIVVSKSERVFNVPVAEIDQYNAEDLLYMTSDVAYFKKHFVPTTSEDDTELEEIDSETASLRATTSYRAAHPTYWDYIWKANLTTKEDFESWSKGRPEISVAVTCYGLETKKLRYDDKGWANKAIRYLNSEIIRWDPSEIGKYISYYWYEEDGGGEETITISLPGSTVNGVTFPSTSYSFKIESGDDEIGLTHVNYDDPSPTEYDPNGSGLFKFWIQVKAK